MITLSNFSPLKFSCIWLNWRKVTKYIYLKYPGRLIVGVYNSVLWWIPEESSFPFVLFIKLIGNVIVDFSSRFLSKQFNVLHSNDNISSGVESKRLINYPWEVDKCPESINHIVITITADRSYSTHILCYCHLELMVCPSVLATRLVIIQFDQCFCKIRYELCANSSDCNSAGMKPKLEKFQSSPADSELVGFIWLILIRIASHPPTTAVMVGWWLWLWHELSEHIWGQTT